VIGVVAFIILAQLIDLAIPATRALYQRATGINARFFSCRRLLTRMPGFRVLFTVNGKIADRTP
jgi:hypothetical protein